MKVTGPTATFSLELEPESGMSAEDVEELTLGLRRELLESDVLAVERPPGGEPPPGARAVDALAIGSLVVTLSTTAAGLNAMVGTVRGWLRSNPNRRVALSLNGDTIELTGAGLEAERRLTQLWIERQTFR